MLIDYHMIDIALNNSVYIYSARSEESISTLTSEIHLPDLPLVQEIKSEEILIERRITLTLLQLRWK